MNKYNGLLYIFDREENLLSILNNEASESDIFFDDEFKKEINGEWSYKFSVDLSRTKDLVLEYNKVGFYDRRGNFQLFIMHDIEDNIGYEAIRTVYCLHDFQALNEDIIEDGKVAGNAKKALELALKDSGYSVGNVLDTDEQVKDFSMMTKLDAINSITQTYGLEVYYRLELDETKTKISKRYVDLAKSLGKDTGIVFDFSLNIDSIKRKINNNFFTVLYGRGRQLKDESYANFSEAEWFKGSNPVNKPKGQLWVADEDAIAKYGIRKGIYSNQNISSPGALLKRTWEKLQKVNRPKINYEAYVYELSSIAGYEDLKINLGDRFSITDDKYNINESIRVIAEYESILDETSKRVELGDPVSCFTDEPDSDDYVDIEDSENPGEGDGYGEVEGEDTLPNVPIVTAKGSFDTVSVSWTFENKSYYTYELYASDVKGFEPTEKDKVFEGKASAFLHEVEPLQVWHYKARAKNGYGKYTDFSEEVSAETLKIKDGAKYFESAAIGDALIGELNLDRGWVGELKGNYIDAKQLSVTDGNGKRTLDIDSFGNVDLDVNSLNIRSKSVATNEAVTNIEQSLNSQIGKISNKVSKIEEDYVTNTEYTQTNKEFNYKLNQNGYNELENSAFQFGDWGIPSQNGLSSSEFRIVDNSNTKSGKSYHMWAVQAGVSAGMARITKEFEVNMSKGDYTFSFYASKVSGDYLVTLRVFDNNSSYNIKVYEEFNSSRDKFLNFKIDNDCTCVQIELFVNGHNNQDQECFNVDFADFMIRKGYGVVWTPNPNEIFTRNIKIDQQGLWAEHSKKDTKTLIDENGMTWFGSGMYREYHHLGYVGNATWKINSNRGYIYFDFLLPPEFKGLDNVYITTSIKEITTYGDIFLKGWDVFSHNWDKEGNKFQVALNVSTNLDTELDIGVSITAMG